MEMIKYTVEDIEDALELKSKYDEDLDFSNADLRGLDLRGVDLSWTDFRGADLRGVNLRSANVSYSDFEGADLRGAIFKNANCQYANFKDADLDGSVFFEADCKKANFENASIRRSNLQDGDFKEANFENASLTYSLIKGANMKKAIFRRASIIGTDYGALQCPAEGAFIAYMYAMKRRLAKLLIPEDAKRSSSTSRKCRANKAVILEITSLDGTQQYDEVEFYGSSSMYGEVYAKGAIIEVEDFDDDRWNSRSPGVYFYITKSEAIFNSYP